MIGRMSNGMGPQMIQRGSCESEPVEILLFEDTPGDLRRTGEAFAMDEVDTRIRDVRDGVGAPDYRYQRGEYADVERPDLVLLDLDLPRKNGDAVLAEIREDPELPRLPVIVLSSSADETDVSRSYELEADAYLTKPVEAEAFTETIDAVESVRLSTVGLLSEGERDR